MVSVHRRIEVLGTALLLLVVLAGCSGHDNSTEPDPNPDPNAALLGTWTGVMNSQDTLGVYRDSLVVVISKNGATYGMAFNMGATASDPYPAVIDSISDPVLWWRVFFWGDTLTFHGTRSTRLQGTMESALVNPGGGTWYLDKVVNPL